MNTRTKKPSTLCAALGGAGLARTGAMLALALGAAQAGATTYTVPLQFNITLAAPVCSLTVGGSTANAATPIQTTGPVVNLTTSPYPLATAAPKDIVTNMTGLTTYTADAPGLHFPSTNHTSISRYVSTPPTAKALCTAGTPMTASVSKISLASGGVPNSGYMLGTSSDAAQTSYLPIGMLMGIARFGASSIGTSGLSGVTWAGTVPTVSATATGSDQDIILTASVHGGTATAALASSMAGQWTYTFNVNLQF